MAGRVMVYVDGFNLYYGLVDSGSKRYLWLNVYQFSLSILQVGQSLEGVRYFTSKVPFNAQDKTKAKRQEIYLGAISSLSGVEVHYGSYLKKIKMHDACNLRHKFYEERQTDVNIATNLLCDAHDDLFDTAIIVSGDSDLASAVAAISLRFDNKEAVICFPPFRFSKELSRAASHCMFPMLEVFGNNQLSDPHIDGSGRSWNRPIDWV